MTGSIIDFDQQVLGCAESAPQPPFTGVEVAGAA
jgi:hypothetical protein